MNKFKYLRVKIKCLTDLFEILGFGLNRELSNTKSDYSVVFSKWHNTVCPNWRFWTEKLSLLNPIQNLLYNIIQ